MELTDAQIHIWRSSTPERPWPVGGSEYAHGLASYTASTVEAAMDRAGVLRAVLVPPSFEGDYNDVCLAAARDRPSRFAVMGRVDLTDRRANVPMAVWRDQPGMLGVRVTFTRGPATAWITDGTADWLWREAERAGVPIMIHAPGQSAAIRLIAERHPELKLTIDHVGLTSRTLEHEIDDAIASVVALADCDNIAVKATALPVVVSDAYPFASLSGRISKIFDAFGPHRMFWGSDLSRLPEPRCTYRQAVNHFTEELDFLTREDLTWIMGAGVEAWLGWDVPHRQVTRPGGESGGRP